MKEKVQDYVDWIHSNEERLKELEDKLQKRQFEKEQIQRLPATVRHSMWSFKDLILKYRTRNMHIKYKDLDDISKEIEELQNQKKLVQKDLTGYSNHFISSFTSDIIAHSSNPSYINNFINQMPFEIRSNFINSSVYTLIRDHMRGFRKDVTDELYTDIVNVYESNIETELRQRLDNSPFEKVCEKLHTNTQYVANPYGTRNMAPAYNCINISLYRLDKELTSGKTFGQELYSRNGYNPNNSLGAILDHYYKFNRTTYNYQEQVKHILDDSKNSYKYSLKVEDSKLNKDEPIIQKDEQPQKDTGDIYPDFED